MWRSRKRKDSKRGDGLQDESNRSSSYSSLRPWVSSVKSCGETSDTGSSVFIYSPRSGSILNSSQEIYSEMAVANLTPPEHLYGRDNEIQILLGALQLSPNNNNSSSNSNGNSNNRNRVVLVSGTSGVGKTALVNEALSRIDNSNSNSNTLNTKKVCIRGKYDFSQRRVPYSGITIALRQLCEHYLHPKSGSSSIRSSSISVEQKAGLQKALGSSVHALEQLLPALVELIGLERELPDLINEGNNEGNEHTPPMTTTIKNLEEAPHRFRFAIQNFLWTLAKWNEHPIVMVLDDLQFADAESFRLLEALMEVPDDKAKGAKGGSLLVIGCYRNDEENSMLAEWIQGLGGLGEGRNQSKISVTRVPVSNLTIGATSEMLADVLRMDAHETLELASVVHVKTLGNPFFVLEFLKSLQQNDILIFNLLKMKWTWNMEELGAKTEATDNVIDHMQRTMKSLPKELCEILPLAASLGSIFSSRKLAAVLFAFQTENDDRKVSAAKWLGACVELGLIVCLGDEIYSWVHDKVQEAALSLVPPGELESVQFRIGEVLLGNLSPIEVREYILELVNLLIKGLPNRANIQEQKCLEISKLCLEAGHTVMASASFSQAVVYLEAGINFLHDNHWESQPQLSLELYTSAAEAESCAGDCDRIQHYCNVVIDQNDLSMTEKFRAYDVLMQFVRGKNNDHRKASAMAVHVLSELGCKLPKRGQLLHVLWGIIKMKGAMKKFGPDSIVSVKEMTEQPKIQAMIMLDRLATVSYQLRSPYLPLAILKSFDLSVKSGISEYSPSAFALVSLILMAKLKDFELARTYATYAVNLIEARPQFDVAKSRTLFLAHGFVLHASIPYQSCAKRFLEGYQSGLATGDVENACWNAMLYLDISFLIGKSLLSLNEDWSVYTKQMSSLSQHQPMIQSKHLWQVAQNLLGLSDDPLLLKGEAFVFDATELKNLEIPVVVSVYNSLVYLAYFMCDDTNGAKRVLELYSMYTEDQMDPGTFLDDSLQAHAAVLCYSAARKTKKTKYVARGKRCHKHIRTIGKKGNPNLSPIEKLLDAEYAALKGRKSAAKSYYEAAIALAARRGLVSEQAIINERFADFLFDCLSDYNEAHYRYTCAIDLFQEWGGVVKVQRLQDKLTLNNMPAGNFGS